MTQDSPAPDALVQPAPVQGRVRQRATAPAPAPLAAWYPWADKKGRPSLYRGIVFALLLLPAAWLLGRWASGTLGARPLTEVLHGTGDWTIWILLASLVVTPSRAVLATPQAVVVRRMVGLGALAYAGVHFVLYIADQNWRLLHVASEIVLRFYLLIGFVALVGLCVLGWTSRDSLVRSMGTTWKRLHKVVYLLAALGVLHFFLQSKADVSRATLAAGLLAWCLLWRLLPAGRDRSPLVMLGLALATAIATLGIEWAWYQFGTHADALRVVRGEFDGTFGLHPAGQVLALGALVAAVAQLRAFALAGTERWWFHVLLYVGGAAMADFAVWALNLGPLNPGMPNLGAEDLGSVPGWWAAAVWLVLLALLGMVRFWLPADGPRRWLDAAWVLCLLAPVAALALDDDRVALAGNVLLGVVFLALAARLLPRSRRGAAVAMLLVGWIAYATVSAGLLASGAA